MPLRHVRSMSEEPILLEAAARNDRDTLAVQFTILLNRNPDYAQVRWLAPDGMERVRIDRQGQHLWRVTDDQLQNKGERYYFRDAMALPWERVYVSPLDLNVEHGVIDRPFNPILNAKGDSLRRRWEGNFAGASAPLVLNVLLDHLQRCSAARAHKVRA